MLELSIISYVKLFQTVFSLNTPIWRCETIHTLLHAGPMHSRPRLLIPYADGVLIRFLLFTFWGLIVLILYQYLVRPSCNFSASLFDKSVQALFSKLQMSPGLCVVT